MSENKRLLGDYTSFGAHWRNVPMNTIRLATIIRNDIRRPRP